MKIVIASDHGGFKIKNKVKQHLFELGHEVIDVGPEEFSDQDDYPDYVVPAVTVLLQNPGTIGIVTCRNGVGVSMLANKYPGIRCGLCFNRRHAISAKNDDDINILALPADYISEVETYEIVDAFLNTPAGQEEKYTRRLAKLATIDKENFIPFLPEIKKLKQ